MPTRQITVRTQNNNITKQFTAISNDKKVLTSEVSKYVQNKPHNTSVVTITTQK